MKNIQNQINFVLEFNLLTFDNIVISKDNIVYFYKGKSYFTIFSEVFENDINKFNILFDKYKLSEIFENDFNREGYPICDKF